LKTILGVCKVKRGSVKLNGERIDTRPSKRIIANGVSIVPENRRIFPHMTVFENLELGAYLQTGSIVLADTAQNLLCNEMMQAAYLGRADVCESPL
jgi:ABC-type branched-subunit amino acid transport system ATPase component